jgi:hypothetical protein
VHPEFLSVNKVKMFAFYWNELINAMWESLFEDDHTEEHDDDFVDWVSW